MDAEKVRAMGRPIGLPFKLNKIGHIALYVQDLQRAAQFAGGDDVRTQSRRGHQFEDGAIAVGLDGVADRRVEAMQRLLQRVDALADRAGGVGVERRAEPVGERGEIDAVELRRGPGVHAGGSLLDGQRAHELSSWNQKKATRKLCGSPRGEAVRNRGLRRAARNAEAGR